METQAVYQISLIAAYIAGMVALFAPCCISYLFPAYLGNVFKERKQVLFMTLIYSLGIFVVMMPIVLGAKALQSVFFDLHDQTYLFGGVFMIFVAVLSFLGIKLPMPHIAIKQNNGQNSDVFSTFTLGIFSGITSACCAPVLIGVVALSSLSPTVLQSIGVGAFYVLGMVTPLYLASLFIHKRNILKNPLLKKVVTSVKIGGRVYPIFVSNIVAALIFGITGILMLWLTSTGKLGMSVAESQATKSINNVAFTISEVVSSIPGLDIVFVIVGGYLLFRFVKNAFKTDNVNMKEGKYRCPMHPDVTSDKPGSCPKCHMDLVKMGEEDMHGKHDHSHMDHSSMMASPEAAKDFLNRFFIVTALLVPLFIVSKIGQPLLQFAVATAIFYFGRVFFQHARHEIMAKKYGMMTLVSVATTAGYLFSAAGTFLPGIDAEFYLEISTLIWVLLFGHYLEAKSSTAAGDALSEVAKLLPKKARVISGKSEKEVDVEDLKKGDIVRVLAGEKVPADGKIIKGYSNFNESHISGESKPLRKQKDDLVVAGAICMDGSVDVSIMRVGDSSTIGQIKTLISEAGQTKPSAQRLADKAASWLTFIALSVALITIVVWLAVLNAGLAFAMTLAITVLVIACPHALGLAIPTVSTIATRLAVKNGLFIKDMGKLEVAKGADYVVFDKTGTLTKGNFTVTKADPKILMIAASIESHSSHVIGKSIVEYAKLKKIKIRKVTSIKNIAGKGIEGKIGNKKYFVGKYKNIPIAILENKKFLGEIVLSDEVKPESKKAISDLHNLGIKVAMLTGDSEDVAKEVADKLEVDKYFSEVLPKDKYKHIKKLQENGSVVIMVGDGVNDAPALTQANVGVAVGAGTDVAVEAGDVVLTSSNPENVVSFIKLSRKVYSKMIQNLYWALGYNVLAIPAAAGLFIPFGFRLTPAVGALLMSLSSVIVVVNAMSLRRVDLSG
jgi:Cu2+-exporting ATPase